VSAADEQGADAASAADQQGADVPSAPRLSVVVVTHESRGAIESSLPALLGELRPDDELIVVDNASADGTGRAVRDLAPGAGLIEQEDNPGYGAGCNAGAEAASGELLVFLNPDAVVRRGFREAIERPMLERTGWDAWQGLVTAAGGKVVNSDGGVVHFTGIAWAGGAGRPVAPPAPDQEVAFASGACLAVPRECWRRAGGFPPELFLYHEDVDLSLRLRLAGGLIGIAGEAVVDHDYEFSKGPAKWRYMERNRWATMIRTYPGALLVLLSPALIATEVALLGVALAGGWSRQKLLAWADLARWLPRLRRERRQVQATRQVSAAEFARALTAELDSPFLGRLARLSPLRVLLRAYWSAVLMLLGRSGNVAPSEPRSGRTQD
jgi:GT2 family glycosyltransferase